MSTLALETAPHAVALQCTADALVMTLHGGHILSVPLVWFPRWIRATSGPLAAFEWLGMGEGIHWPRLDKNISIAGLLEGLTAPNALRLALTWPPSP